MRVLLLFFSISAFAAGRSPSSSSSIDFKGSQGRMFVLQQSISPANLNDQIGLYNKQDPFSKFYGAGIEVTQNFLTMLNLGLRYEGKYAKNKPENALTAYASIQQTSFYGVLRIDVINSTYFKFDLFGAAGISGIDLDLRKSQSENYYNRNLVGSQKAGASMAVGFANYYLMVEAGHEWSNFGTLKPKTTEPDVMTNINLSGNYILAGFVITGDALKNASKK